VAIRPLASAALRHSFHRSGSPVLDDPIRPSLTVRMAMLQASDSSAMPRIPFLISVLMLSPRAVSYTHLTLPTNRDE